MYIIEAYRHGYKEAWYRALELQGRTSRSAYWEFILIHFAISALFLMVDLTGAGGMSLHTLPDLAYGVISFVPLLSTTVRRLHDTGRSGWWLCCVLIPAIGWLIVIYFLVQPVHHDDDQDQFVDMNRHAPY